MTIEERVAAGAGWLDAQSPGWERQIDLGDLDVASCTECILGQIYGDFNVVYKEKAAEFGSSTRGRVYMAAMGFAKEYSEVPICEECRRLGEAWTALIKERFDTGALSA